MNAKILNRDYQHPADGWYQIEPKGNHPNRAAAVVQVIDAEAITSIVNRFNADASAGKLRHGNEMLIDHEHFSGDTDKESRAYGWLQELQNRDDGIYGRIRWTTTGKAAVDGGDYRFFSTEYDAADLKVLNADKKAKQIRPLRLDGLSLTNMPNNRGQKPITNRDDNTLPGSRESGASPNHNNERTNTMKSIAQKLGLAPEASEDAILGEVTKVLNRLSTADAELTPLKNRVATLETENQTLLGEQIDADMATSGIRDEKVINRHKPVLSDPKHFKNRAERVEFIKDLAKPEGKGSQARIINRGDGKGGQQETAADTGTEQELAGKIRNRCDELTGKGLKFDAAWQQASRELTAKN